MKPQVLLQRSTTPDGMELVLYERDGVFTIRVNGLELMSSRAHGSEEAMAELVLGETAALHPRVLVGGLGMGYTLRAVLDRVSFSSRITVAELLPEIVQWNRDHLAHLAGSPLDDQRVTLVVDDVGRVMAAKSDAFDAILLDVDNGPAALTDRRNARLYLAEGLAAIRRSLRRGGVLGVWSAGPDQDYERALKRAGFRYRVETVRARPGAKGPKHTVFIAAV
jgi:spermidine synthase